MPRCLYTLCCESYSIDRDTGMLSAFKLIERIALAARSRSGAAPSGPLPLRLCVIATWVAEAEDAGRQFEPALRLISFDGRQAIRPVAGPFEFRRDLHRIVANVTIGVDPAALSGPARLEAQPLLREVGKADWIEGAAYPVQIEVSRAPARPAPPAPPVT